MRTLALVLVAPLLSGCVGWTSLPNDERIAALEAWDPAPVTTDEVAYQLKLTMDPSVLMPEAEELRPTVEALLRKQFPNSRRVSLDEGDDPSRWSGDHDYALRVELETSAQLDEDSPGAYATIATGVIAWVLFQSGYGIPLIPLVLPLAITLPFIQAYRVTCRVLLFDRRGCPRTWPVAAGAAAGSLLVWVPLAFLPITPFAVETLPELAVRDQLSRLAEHPAWTEDERVLPLDPGVHEVSVAPGPSQDWYAFECETYARVEYSFEPTARGSETTRLEVVDPFGRELCTSADEAALSFRAESSGTYFLRVTHSGAATVSGKLALSVVGPHQDAYEANDTREAATALTPGVYAGLTASEDDDWYVVGVGAGETLRVRIEFQHEARDLELSLCGADGRPLGNSWSSADYEELEHTSAETERVHIRVFGTQAGYCGYRLEVLVSPPPQPAHPEAGSQDGRRR